MWHDLIAIKSYYYRVFELFPLKEKSKAPTYPNLSYQASNQ